MIVTSLLIIFCLLPTLYSSFLVFDFLERYLLSIQSKAKRFVMIMFAAAVALIVIYVIVAYMIAPYFK